MKKNCVECKAEFETENEMKEFCSDECKQQAIARLDGESDECLSCQ